MGEVGEGEVVIAVSKGVRVTVGEYSIGVRIVTIIQRIYRHPTCIPLYINELGTPFPMSSGC